MWRGAVTPSSRVSGQLRRRPHGTSAASSHCRCVCLLDCQVEEMEPNIRYCNYRISRAGGAVPADPAELMALGGGGDTGALPGLDLLQVGRRGARG